MKSKQITFIFFLFVATTVSAQTQTQNLNMGLHELQFSSASGGNNRIRSFGGTHPGRWLFKSRFDNIEFDAGENENNKYALFFSTGGVQRMRVTPSGRLSIGNLSSFQERVSIKALDDDNKSIDLGFTPSTNDDTQGGIGVASGGHISLSGYNYLTFNTNGGSGYTERMRINPNGDIEVKNNIFFGTNQLNFSSANGGYNRIRSFAGSHPGRWLFKSRFDNIEIDAGENANNKFGIVFMNGGVEAVRINPTGNVGIGTNITDSKLTVKGNISSREVRVTATAGGADFVFEESYELPTLEDTEAFINNNKHLPDIPSAVEMEENGLYLAEINIKLLQKIEELTLHMIDMNKRINELETENQELKK